MRWVCLLALALFSTGAELRAADATWTHGWWLEKTVRRLRGGIGLQSSDDRTALLKMPREQVVQRLVTDPRFADLILGFNAYWVGYPMDQVKNEQGEYQQPVYDLPHVITSARTVLTGGDYFSLFDLEQPLYFGDLPRPQEKSADDKKLSDAQLRRQNFEAIQADLRKMVAHASSQPPPSIVSLCAEFQDHIQARFELTLGLSPLGFVLGTMMNAQDDWYQLAYNVCANTTATAAEFRDAFTRIIDRNEVFFAQLAPFEDAVYRTPDLRAVRAADTSGFGPTFHYTQFTYRFQADLQNSSTNLDRRRGAYFLKRFFCDDLTPVNVEMPSGHAGDVHGSDPACFACHYKLDPMAGYFRNVGAYFRDYSTKATIQFDDNVVTDRAKYVEHWKAPAGSKRQWNVGYIRSLTDEKANTYGDTPADLLRLLRTAPEVKRCLVQRMYEFLVSDAQTVDGDYLDSLAEKFNRDLAQGSTPALQNLVSSIVLSKAYSTPNPNADTCYDYRPGTTPSADAPPCKIASVLAKNCVSCHRSTDGGARLDLSHFRRLADGTLGFPHLDAAGQPVATKATFHALVDRLSSTDADRRMPYLQDMPSQDRQALYNWASEEEGQ